MKKFLLGVIFSISLLFGITYSAPSFKDEGVGTDVGYDLNQTVNTEHSLKDNIINLFFPSSDGGGMIWNNVRNIFVGLIFVLFIRAGSIFVLKADDEAEIKKAKTNILYLMYGTFLIFGSVWILGTVLNVGGQTTADVLVEQAQVSLIGKVLIFFKSMAYYAAFLMTVYYGFKMVQAQEKEDKIKTAKTGVVNIIVALVAIKVLDYVYFIAQSKEFASKGSDFIAGVGKILGWILGIILVLSLLYAGTLMLTSRGDEEAWKKSKTIIKNILIAVFVIFLFLVIAYDLFKNFGKDISV